MPSTSRTYTTAFAISLLLQSTLATSGFSCDDIVSNRIKWNLKELGGPRMVHWIRELDPAVSNFTFTLDICKPLVKHKDALHSECPGNTRVCGVEKVYNEFEGTNETVQVVPIAGDYQLKTGQHLESEVFRLKDSGSNGDSEKEGLRVELSGGRQPLSKTGKMQKAIIEFLCDPNRDGKDTELDDRPGDEDDKDGEEKRRRRRDEEKKKKKKKKDEDKSLRFLSYKDEKIRDEDWGVLRLDWKTKYACEEAINEPGPSDGHWGVFTWLVIIVFLATAAYLIFGSWLNYNRYGARGLDAIPHGDTIRDLPYIMSDFGRKVASTLQGGGSRGGYSAV